MLIISQDHISLKRDLFHNAECLCVRDMLVEPVGNIMQTGSETAGVMVTHP